MRGFSKSLTCYKLKNHFRKKGFSRQAVGPSSSEFMLYDRRNYRKKNKFGGYVPGSNPERESDYLGQNSEQSSQYKENCIHSEQPLRGKTTGGGFSRQGKGLVNDDSVVKNDIDFEAESNAISANGGLPTDAALLLNRMKQEAKEAREFYSQDYNKEVAEAKQNISQYLDATTEIKEAIAGIFPTHQINEAIDNIKAADTEPMEIKEINHGVNEVQQPDVMAEPVEDLPQQELAAPVDEGISPIDNRVQGDMSYDPMATPESEPEDMQILEPLVEQGVPDSMEQQDLEAIVQEPPPQEMMQEPLPDPFMMPGFGPFML